VLLDRISTKINLTKNGVLLSNTVYELCSEDEETTSQILFNCKIARTIWSKCTYWWGWV